MEYNKLNKLVEKYKLTNILKIAILLICLYILARLFLPADILGTISYLQKTAKIEGFQALGYSYYGNELSLQDPTNTPKYAGNSCTFKFDGVYRLEALNLVFNNNNNTSSLDNSTVAFNPINIQSILIQYEDGNGNMKYIKSSTDSSPPNFNNSTNLTTTTTSTTSTTSTTNRTNNELVYSLNVSDITDENNLIVYTSKIIVIVGNTNNSVDKYLDNCNKGYFSNFAFWGSTRDMLSKKDFESLSNTLSLKTFALDSNTFDDKTNTDIYKFTTPTDFLLYAINTNYMIKTVSTYSTTTNAQSCPTTTNSPFNLSISYNNGLYTGNNFTINTQYVVRNDPYIVGQSNINNNYIILPQPIIVNTLIIMIPRVKSTSNSNNVLQLEINSLQGYGSSPSQNNITDYKRTVNALLSVSSQSENVDICPSMDNLIVKQNQAQQICDNLEYQDKIKTEKIRLERNKQYLLKLKQQQEQIDKLNQVIQTLNIKQQKLAKADDIARVLQYQQQKGLVSKVSDIANERIQSQDNNQLHLDVNFNAF